MGVDQTATLKKLDGHRMYQRILYYCVYHELELELLKATNILSITTPRGLDNEVPG